jgi:RNA polymerase sigma-70 factor (ECF subfamily)
VVDEPSDAAVIADSLDEPRCFADVYDRHAGSVFRYLVRRVGRDAADELLGESFRVAFERRGSYDLSRPNARPWLYGIATNLLSHHRRTESRRLHATARMAAQVAARDEVAEQAVDAVDAAALWPKALEAVAALPDGERDALLLHVWEELSYDEVATALGIPVGTVRSRLNRARTTLRHIRRDLRPDSLQAATPNDPWVLADERERLMSAIDTTREARRAAHYPAMYPRLAYDDERAALEFLTRVFGFRERREARMEFDEKNGILAWLELGDGVVMIGRTETAVHEIVSPQQLGGRTSVMINVHVDDVDAHYERAQAEGATIVMEINDAFYGDRRYEALDLEGHRWHFHQPLAR